MNFKLWLEISVQNKLSMLLSTPEGKSKLADPEVQDAIAQMAIGDKYLLDALKQYGLIDIYNKAVELNDRNVRTNDVMDKFSGFKRSYDEI